MPACHLHIETGHSEKKDYTFTEPFRIGRGSSCQVRLSDDVVSRKHAEVLFIGDRWWLRDLGSANGTFIDGRRIEHAALQNGARIRFGADGPSLSFSLEEKSPPDMPAAEDHSLTYYRRHYFDEKGDGPAGEHTMMIRQVFSQVQEEQARPISTALQTFSREDRFFFFYEPPQTIFYRGVSVFR